MKTSVDDVFERLRDTQNFWKYCLLLTSGDPRPINSVLHLIITGSLYVLFHLPDSTASSVLFHIRVNGIGLCIIVLLFHRIDNINHFVMFEFQLEHVPFVYS